MKAVKYISFLLTLLGSHILYAQEKAAAWESGFIYHFGYLSAHRNDLYGMVRDYSRIAEFNFAKKFNGEKDWEIKYNYPDAGIAFMYFDFGNPEQLGRGASLMGFVNFPLVRSGKFAMKFKLGFGSGYVEKVFDIVDNYKNYAVSTHFNGFAHGNLTAQWQPLNHLGISCGLSISHFSNASAKKPNLGMNIPAVNAGIQYRFGKSELRTRADDYVFDFNRKWNHDFILSFGRKSSEIGGDRYGIADIAYSASKSITFKSTIAGGADVFYNTAHDGEEGKNGEALDGAGDILQAGVNVGYMLLVDRMGVYINQGVYLYTKYDEDGMLYHRFGIRYFMLDHFVLNLSMKTHFAVADHVELGIGYRL